MTVKERILTIRLSESIRHFSDYASKIGLSVAQSKERAMNQTNRNKVRNIKTE